MSDRLTPAQYLTLDLIEKGGGVTWLMRRHWRTRHYQALIKRRLVRLRANPFATGAWLLRGQITAAARRALRKAPVSLRAKAAAHLEKIIRDHEAQSAGDGA